MVVDALFCDNIYNVWLNIKEMLRYNSKLDAEDKVLDKSINELGRTGTILYIKPVVSFSAFFIMRETL